MQPTLNISAEWERLDEGELEERACFAALGIQCNDRWLAEGLDGFVNRVRQAPLLSAYHMAEWMAWNWWRLRWEPRSNAPEWAFAHRLTTIGHGYVWPNVTIFSDGERTALIAKPTQERPATFFRYISDFAAIVPSGVFESAVDRFFGQVLGQLQAEGITETNLHRIHADLSEERQDREAARRRKLEALLGKDPDEADLATLERLVADAGSLGEQAVEELAADHASGSALLSADSLEQIAAGSGFAASRRSSVRLAAGTRLPSPHDVPPWLLGADAARALREQEGLGGQPIGDPTLARLAGVLVRARPDGDRQSRRAASLAAAWAAVRASPTPCRAPGRTAARAAARGDAGLYLSAENAALLRGRVAEPVRGGGRDAGGRLLRRSAAGRG